MRSSLRRIRGDLDVEDLPATFADGMERLVGIRPPSDALGAMQDIHWAHGLFGYFPTYTLGNFYAAQLAEAADAELGGIERAVEEAPARHPEIHARARTTTAPASRRPSSCGGRPGRELSDALIAHLERSYVAAA